MTIASDYPFVDILGSMLFFFGFVIWIWLLFTVFADLFRRHDVSGWGKAGWTIFMIVLPFIGVLSYLIINSSGMAERRAKDVREAQTQFDDYVRNVAGDSGGAAAEIDKAKKLLDSGAIDQAEFDSLKRKALA